MDYSGRVRSAGLEPASAALLLRPIDSRLEMFKVMKGQADALAREKKDKREYTDPPEPNLYRQDEERALAQAIGTAKAEAERAVRAEDFAGAMQAMARLRPYVDAFFDKVTVNVDEASLRENRLKLLNEIRAATRAVADFSKIEG